MEIVDILASFAGKQTRELSIMILEDDYQEAMRLFESREIDPDEGFLVALAAGMAEIRRQESADLDEDSLSKQLNRLDSALVGLRLKAFYLAKDNERMEMATQGWKTENEGLRQLVNRLRAELGQTPPIIAPPVVAAQSMEYDPNEEPGEGQDEREERGSGNFWSRLRGK